MGLFDELFYIKRNGDRIVLKFLFLKFKIFKPLNLAFCILDPGGIGDYLFCRPYFKYIKKTAKYKNHKLIYVGKHTQIDLVRAYDTDLFDEIYEWNEEYFKRAEYRKMLIQLLNKHNIDVLVNLRCTIVGSSEDFYPRYYLAKHVRAKKKYTDCIDFDNQYKNSFLKIYDKVFCTNKENILFEDERRKRFFEDLLEIKIPSESMTLQPLFDTNKINIAISIVAVSKERMFNKDVWVRILNNLLDNGNNVELLFLGSQYDRKIVDDLIQSLNNPSQCKNLAGRTCVSTIPIILRQCKFILAVETGTVHIAHSVGCKSIVLCNGSYYARFQPYNDNLVKYIYPNEFKDLIDKNDKSELINFYGLNTKYSNSDIDENELLSVMYDMQKQ